MNTSRSQDAEWSLAFQLVQSMNDSEVCLALGIWVILTCRLLKVNVQAKLPQKSIVKTHVAKPPRTGVVSKIAGLVKMTMTTSSLDGCKHETECKQNLVIGRRSTVQLELPSIARFSQ